MILKLNSLSFSNIIYDLIFGLARTSYHSVKVDCDRAGFELKTTPLEWLELMRSRRSSRSGMKRELKVKVECKEHGHESYKTIEHIGITGCGICADP